MWKIKSTTLEILAKLKREMFPEENFLIFSFAIHDLTLKKRKQTKNGYDPQKLIAQNTMLFELKITRISFGELGKNFFVGVKFLKSKTSFAPIKMFINLLDSSYLYRAY